MLVLNTWAGVKVTAQLLTQKWQEMQALLQTTTKC